MFPKGLVLKNPVRGFILNNIFFLGLMVSDMKSLLYIADVKHVIPRTVPLWVQ